MVGLQYLSHNDLIQSSQYQMHPITGLHSNECDSA